MNWIAQFRQAILAQAPLLRQHGFSLIGEDDNRIQFTDGELLLKFVVQRYDDSLETYVRHLGEQSTADEYRLDIVMRVMDGAVTQDFVAQTPADHARLIERDVRYILDNKARLFGPTCPYAKAYNDFSRRVAEQAMAQWTAAAKP